MVALEASEATPPKIRHKTFTYRTAVQWTASRSGIVAAEGKHCRARLEPSRVQGRARDDGRPRTCSSPRSTSAR